MTLTAIGADPVPLELWDRPVVVHPGRPVVLARRGRPGRNPEAVDARVRALVPD